MRKTLIVAQSEFATLVRTKAFIISIVLMPVLMAVSFLIVNRLKDAKDVRDRTFAYVDESGVIAPGLEAALAEWNAATGSTDARTAARKRSPRTIRFVLVRSQSGSAMFDGWFE